MTRVCTIPLCGAKARRTYCPCGALLCEEHASSVTKHDCSKAKSLDAIASDPKMRREWLRANSHEETLTTETIAVLNASGVGFFWRTKRRQGAKASDERDGVLDISGVAFGDGRSVFAETKSKHTDECPCDSCEEQRSFAESVRAARGVAVLGIRKAQDAVDRVRMELARVRGKAEAA